MITEKQLLKWGFEKCSESGYELVLEQHEGFDYSVYFDLKKDRIVIHYNLGFVEIWAVGSKRRVDQALHLLGLPSIDKLNTVKK